MSENNGYDVLISAELKRQRATHEAAVEAVLQRLNDDPVCKRQIDLRRNVIRAVVDALVDPSRTIETLWEGGKAIEEGMVNRSTYMSRSSKWKHHAPFMAVMNEVLRLEREWEQMRDGREREARRLAHNQRVLNFADKGYEKLFAMLNFPLSEQVIDTDTGQVIVKPGKWTYGMMAQFGAMLDKAVRLALEMDTDRTRNQTEVSLAPGMEAALNAIYGGGSADGD